MSLTFFSCSDSYIEEIEIDSVWEGERMFIDAQLSINEPISIAITKTVDPIGLDTVKYIDTLQPYIMKGNDKITLAYDNLLNRYVSDTLVEGDFHYQLFVPSGDSLIFSEELFIPYYDFKVKVVKADITAQAAEIIWNYYVPDIDAYRIGMGVDHSLEILQCLPSRKYSNSCYDSLRQLSCVVEKQVDLKWNIDFSRCWTYEYSSDDFVELFLRFESKSLVDQRNNNRYNVAEYGLNDAFTSSFNGAYGIFGYRYEERNRVDFK